MSITTECRPDPRGGEFDPAWLCLTHGGWVPDDEECEGAIGSLHCPDCAGTGCQGADHCDCHDPANSRHERAFA